MQNENSVSYMEVVAAMLHTELDEEIVVLEHFRGNAYIVRKAKVTQRGLEISIPCLQPDGKPPEDDWRVRHDLLGKLLSVEKNEETGLPKALASEDTSLVKHHWLVYLAEKATV